MFRKLVPAMLIAGVALMEAPAFAQEETHRSEVSVQALGSFLKSTTQDGVDHSATNSGGVLANYRFFFNQHHGVEVNYGYTRNTSSYGLASGPLGVGTDNHEISADYVLRFPTRRFSPFVLAGVGALIFDPHDAQLTGAGSQTRAAFVYGGGADFNVTSRIFMRAQYRGFVLNSPTYGVAALSGLDRTTHLAEPSIGFGFRF
ncbi:MAG TPA: outer membrane beta-barrel protein [Bryobacteraceae bacterium]|nr:outer membrane beta-barrel protein [Bryobacteraceae bacterium]